MADIISSNEIFYNTWEAKLKNRFIFYFNDIPSFLIKKANRPKLTLSVVTIPHINIERYQKGGKGKWEPINITLFDPIVPSGASMCMEWLRKAHESVTGRAGYWSMYAQNVKFNILGPIGDKVEQWTLVGAWPEEVDFGDLDLSSDTDITEITMKLRYNYAIQEY